MKRFQLLDKSYDGVFIEPNEWVNVTFAGNVTEVVTALPERKNKIKILSKEEVENYTLDPEKKYYMNIGDGEINECKIIESRKDDYDGVRQSIKRLRDYINANVLNANRCRWITLTYRQREGENSEAVPMTDTKRLYLDFKHFMARLRHHFWNRRIEYIAVAEPQRSGSWHMHVILIFSKKAPFIPNDVLRDKFWKKGFVDIQRLNDNCDNLGAYFSAYLANIEYVEGDPLSPDDEIIEGLDGKGRDKKYIKGGRLKFYPPKFNLYRISKGIVSAVVDTMKYKNLDKSCLGALTAAKRVCLFDEETGGTIIYKYEYYNKAREPEVADRYLENLKQRLRDFQANRKIS